MGLSSKQLFRLVILFLSGGLIISGSVLAADCPSPISSSISINISCTIPSGGVSISSSGSVSSTTNMTGMFAITSGTTTGWNNNGGTVTTTGSDAFSNLIYINGANVTGGISNSGTLTTQGNRWLYLINSNFAGGITNTGIFSESSGGSPGIRIEDSTFIGGITNSGSITGGWTGMEFVGASSTNTISGGVTNSGSITATVLFGIALNNDASSAQTILNGGINNSGSILGDYSGIYVGAWGTVNGGITNTSTGTIVGTNQYGVLVDTGGIVDSINNRGSITGGLYGINNAGTITTLNNAQGASGALTYTGTLPTNYNIIISSASSFGRLAVTNGTGSTAFGIYTGSSVSNNTKYTAVLSGVTTSQVTNKSGTYSGYGWTLGLESNSSTIWDLIFGIPPSPIIGPSIANTNQSLVNTASALQGTYTLQNSVLANSFSYDCTVFGANDICVSAGGRNTQVQAANGLNNTSALLIAAYRPHPNYRIGAYADQNLSVSNPGGTVNLGNNTPLIGLFAAWNERLDGTGTEVKVSAAYGQKNTTINRSVVGSGAGASEAGSGSSTLNSQGTQLTAKYGFGVIEDLIVSPYVGVRYTQNNMAGYTEGTSSTVTAPLTYSALNTNATTALAGVGASYRVIPQVMTFASAGVETDTNTANGTYSATNTSIGTLTPVNFNANPVKTRPTATVGAYYDIEKNQRLGITGIYRQEAYQAVSTTTVLATYTVGL